jgi:cytidine deaminase
MSLSTSQIVELQQHAIAAAEHSYSPYSRFRVGAAILLDTPEDTIVTGCNVENASYRLTTCAEQSAIVSAVSQYGPNIRIRAIAIANLNNAASEPCGACRQTISEFSTPATRIYFPAADGTTNEASMADLLPAAFVLQHQQTPSEK